MRILQGSALPEITGLPNSETDAVKADLLIVCSCDRCGGATHACVPTNNSPSVIVTFMLRSMDVTLLHR